MDENTKDNVSSMNKAVFVDENTKQRLPSMKSAQNVDENCQNHEREHETEVDRPSKCF